MKTATQNLEEDHVYILRLIDVMERMAQSSGGSVKDFETVVYLIKNFADGVHHAKEEDLLFPLMVKKGFSNQQGPIYVMLQDHVQGRNYVKSMVEGIARLKEGDASAINEIYSAFQGYIMLLRSHISKENNVLFKMADNALSEEEQNELLLEFSKVENSNNNNNLKSYIQLIENLEKELIS